MLQLIGRCLLLGGIAALGFNKEMALKRRVTGLRGFQRATEQMERELTFSLPPIIMLLGRIGKGSSGVAATFFAGCQTRFSNRGEERLEEIWSATVEELPSYLLEEDRQVIQEIGGILGRYDGESQREALLHVQRRLEENLQRATEEAERLGKVYTALGITIGLFVVILL